MVKNFTKRYRRQELKPVKKIVILESEVIDIEEIDIKDIPADAILMDELEVIPDGSNNLDKILNKKNNKKSKVETNNTAVKTENNE